MQSPFVLDVTAAAFEKDVVKASKQAPVIVDLGRRDAALAARLEPFSRAQRAISFFVSLECLRLRRYLEPAITRNPRHDRLMPSFP